MSDPKRLLEVDQDAPSPNVLLQNLLGAAQADGIPRAVRQRTLKSIESAVSSAAPRAGSAQSPDAAAR